MVSERVLLEGAWFGLEQCGILLRDAVTLHRCASRASAVGLAMLAREEMGKARILLDFWRDAVNKGRKVSAAEIRRKLDDHEEKQRKAQVSQLLTAGEIGTEAGGTRMAKLLRTLTTSGHSTSEREAAQRELDELRPKLLKRTPMERHKARMRALYVDLNESATGWSRPTEMLGDARAILEHAAGDYAGQWDRFQGRLGILAHVEPKLAAALEQWPERPALPEPSWPDFPPRPNGK
jgi:AbiV family abortive infection protein